MGVGTRQLRNKKWTNCISLKVLNNGILYILSTIQKKGEGRRSERRERRIRKKKRKSKEEREEVGLQLQRKNSLGFHPRPYLFI